MPPRMKYKEAKLEQILEQVDDSFTNVLEFRNETWWNSEVFERLSSKNITFCSMSYPDLPDEVVANAKAVYYRFHGVPRLYQSKYELDVLERVANEIKGNSAIKQAFIYFNNDIDASAITNAFQMQSYVDKLKRK